ncbi:MAG: alpha/beta hydrolase [Gammaproteobacteria bacterium]|nr:alpha/beta hydrolase [Gammaproteobacteria bacterium]
MLRPLLPAGFQRMMIQGNVGVLELCYKLPSEITDKTPLLIVAHPHPLHGGSFHNKVVQTVAKAGAELSALVVCFNFRGVGASEGEFDHGHGERYDLLTVVEFAQSHWGKRELWLSGFSFGAWMSALAADQLQPQQLLLVAPPVSLYPMERVSLSAFKLTVIQGSEDEVVDAQQVMQWSQQQRADMLWRSQASHYFHGQLLWLRKAVMMSFSL